MYKDDFKNFKHKQLNIMADFFTILIMTTLALICTLNTAYMWEYSSLYINGYFEYDIVKIQNLLISYVPLYNT